MSHPLDALEPRLIDPPADGVMVTYLSDRGEAGQLGFAVGDVILSVDGQAVTDLGELLRGLKAADGGASRHRDVERIDASGRRSVVEVPSASSLGLHGCAVRRGEPAWEQMEPTSFEPDLGPFLRPHETMMRSSFELNPAGFEIVRVQPGEDGRSVALDHLVHFGGGAGAGETWEYRTHSRTVHRLGRTLPVVKSRFTLGAERDGPAEYEMSLVDSEWIGTCSKAGEAPREYRERVVDAEAINNYAVPLLCLLMPQEPGAVLGVAELDETSARLRARSRLVCEGPCEVAVAGQMREAVRFTWRHYGKLRESDGVEQFYVSPDRRMLRIDWGPDYGGCWCETVESIDELTRGLPEHIQLPADWAPLR